MRFFSEESYELGDDVLAMNQAAGIIMGGQTITVVPVNHRITIQAADPRRFDEIAYYRLVDGKGNLHSWINTAPIADALTWNGTVSGAYVEISDGNTGATDGSVSVVGGIVRVRQRWVYPDNIPYADETYRVDIADITLFGATYSLPYFNINKLD